MGFLADQREYLEVNLLIISGCLPYSDGAKAANSVAYNIISQLAKKEDLTIFFMLANTYEDTFPEIAKPQEQSLKSAGVKFLPPFIFLTISQG